MEKNSEKKGKKGLLFAILIVLAALVVFTVIVMAVNSRKPDRITLGAFDKNVKGTAFIRANQMLVEQMVHNWLPNDLFWF